MGIALREMFDLTGRNALVTGGSRGLGLQMAGALGELGARVAITARKQPELDAAAERLRDAGVESMTVAADLSQLETVPEVVDRVLERFGEIDILVNNAGTTWGALAEEYPWEAWKKVLDLNLNAAFLLCQEVGRRSMIPRRTGKIVNVASIAGLAGNPPGLGMKTIAYNTSKAALINFSRALAAEWGRHGINVNVLCPGFFPSKMSKGLLERIGAEVVRGTPLGRLGDEDDLRGPIAFLASEASRHVTGQVLAVDGGASAV